MILAVMYPLGPVFLAWRIVRICFSSSFEFAAAAAAVVIVREEYCMFGHMFVVV